MSIYKHQQYRRECGISFGEEYILGLLEEFGEVKLSFLYSISDYHGVYKSDSIKKVIPRLEQMGAVTKTPVNNKMSLVKLAPQGEEYLRKVKELYTTKGE